MKLNYFNYKQFNDQYLLTNDFGEYLFLNTEHFDALVHHRIDDYPNVAGKLLESHFLFRESNLEFSSKMAGHLRFAKGTIPHRDASLLTSM